ncbi:MAG: universal stress protein [Microthrixaceae bacterium]
MPATIVVGVDGSNDSERTVECAARLADAMDSHLLTVFVFREAGALPERPGRARF